jgi:hypothetical protein
VASDSETGVSRVDGSDPADTDINVSTGATLPSGDSIGLTYYMDATNGTYTSPTLSTNFFLSNPGSFAVTGKAVAAAQAIFHETPTQVTFENDGGAPTELDLVYNAMNATQQYLVPNSSFTCTIFDGSTRIGSATSTVGGTAGGGMSTAFALCAGVYPNNSYGSGGNGDAFVNLPATYNAGDVYTFIISQ